MITWFFVKSVKMTRAFLINILRQNQGKHPVSPDRKALKLNKILLEFATVSWSNIRENMRPILALLTFGVTALAAGPALAEAKTLGDMTNRVYDSLISLQFFLGFLSYILGTFFAITGLQMVRAHVDDPGRNPLQPSMLRLAGAALFLFAPTSANALVRSLGGGGVGDTDLLNTKDFVSVNAGTFSDGNSIEDALGRFVVDFAGPFLENLLPLFAYLVGLVFMFIGLKRLALANENGPQAPGGTGTFGTFIVGAALMSFGYVMYALQGSIFGTDTLYTNPLLKSSSELAKSANNALWAVFIFLRIVGYISVLRGLLMLREMAEGGRASLTAVSTHMIAGSFLANAGAFVSAVQTTFIDDPANYLFTPPF